MSGVKLMRPSHRKAGQNIRNLALQRRVKALTAFAAAAFLIALPFLLRTIFQELLTLFPDSSSSALSLPLIVYVVSLVAGIGCLLNGLYWWRRAAHADQGAQGEEDVAKAIASLRTGGWTIEYGLRLGKGLGDADIVCLSPQNRAYVIDVKSHRGTVVAEEQKLYRLMGAQKYPFEKDFLKQVMKQAFQVKQQKQLKFVTPILAFSNAKVTLKGKIQGVYVVEKSRLSYLLNKLG
ncbi:MAG: nuclease-related domain-containing protein [Cyanobacteria bacterium P01_D01_bin.105]